MNNLKSTTMLAATAAPILPPEPKKKRKLKVVVIGPNGGGVRKTKTALAIGSVAAAAGLGVIYVCADRGIGSLSASLLEGGPSRVELLPDEETGSYADTLIALADEDDADIIIIDLGANEMLNSKSRRTVRAALRQLKALGHDTYVVLSLVPNKVGLEDDAGNFARQMSKDAEVVIAVHGRDEGGELAAFDELMELYPALELPTDQLGILGLIAGARVTPFNWCSAPTSGFSLAAAWTAHNLMQLAQQPVMVQIVGTDSAVPVLAELAKDYPRRFYTTRNSRWQVRDESLAADADEIVAMQALQKLSVDDEDSAILAPARAFLRASRARMTAHQIARAACA